MCVSWAEHFSSLYWGRMFVKDLLLLWKLETGEVLLPGKFGVWRENILDLNMRVCCFP